MKNYTLYILLVSIAFFSSCKKEEEKPKVIYETTQKTTSAVVVDTTKVLVADLPIHMDGTNYLLFPIGDLNFSKRMNYGSSSRNNSVSYTVSNYGEYEITGYLNNIKFKEIGKDTIYALTDKPVIIQSATYLKDHATKNKQQLLVYVLEDMDTNKDAKLDESDIKSLYISSIDGKNFTKLSTDFQELIDWKYLEANSSIYFRTAEDTNKNGEMDSSDKIYYSKVNLLDKEWKVETYNPAE
ncbi:hypothetical protein [Flavobacterium capsici]|uniref:Lipoprotein n=1 Tax=Flavobacterium capsici TaxID=3075618 RepID=A0AA96EVK6_9FLAO|nr:MULTISPECIES: hypothetical protein [unclassified Flavobacterium]WNM18996.1 hypothetical protein RN608_13395 [Flavobacterium sp. PMR2A8]WNM23046.1 hypothetical protein RN605_06695 [Flavobacterium sp. PMTSA4]